MKMKRVYKLSLVALLFTSLVTTYTLSATIVFATESELPKAEQQEEIVAEPDQSSALPQAEIQAPQGDGDQATGEPETLESDPKQPEEIAEEPVKTPVLPQTEMEEAPEVANKTQEEPQNLAFEMQEPTYYTLTASVVEGEGKVTPGVVKSFKPGVSTTLTMTPAAGYKLTGVALTGGAKRGQLIQGKKGATTVEITMGSSDATAKVTFVKEQFVLSYDANGGTGNMVDSKKLFDTEFNLSTNTFTKDGYKFTGWKTKAGSIGTTSYADEELYTMTSENITLFAQWEKIDPPTQGEETHQLTIKVVGATGGAIRVEVVGATGGAIQVEDKIDIDNLKRSTNVKLTLIPAPGYEVAEGYPTWTTNASVTTLGSEMEFRVQMQQMDVTFQVAFTKKQYLATYMSGVSGGQTVTRAGIYGDFFKVLSLVETGFVNPGNDFTGWNDALDGKGTSYKAGDKIKIEDKNITLYAQWKATSTNPDPGENPRPGGRPTRPTSPDVAIIEEVEPPLAQAPVEEPVIVGAADAKTTDIEEDNVPLAQLPQTGGLGSLAFLGMGALIAALGVGLKKKESK